MVMLIEREQKKSIPKVSRAFLKFKKGTHGAYDDGKKREKWGKLLDFALSLSFSLSLSIFLLFHLFLSVSLEAVNDISFFFRFKEVVFISGYISKLSQHPSFLTLLYFLPSFFPVSIFFFTREAIKSNLRRISIKGVVVSQSQW